MSRPSTFSHFTFANFTPYFNLIKYFLYSFLSSLCSSYYFLCLSLCSSIFFRYLSFSLSKHLTQKFFFFIIQISILCSITPFTVSFLHTTYRCHPFKSLPQLCIITFSSWDTLLLNLLYCYCVMFVEKLALEQLMLILKKN